MKSTLQFVTCLLGIIGPATSLAQVTRTSDATVSGLPVAPVGTATDDAEEESFPVHASFSINYRLNHANFVATESEAANFGYQLATLGASIGYDLTDDISVSANVAVDKEISNAFDRPGVGGGSPSSRVRRATALRDVGVSVGWNDFYTIPGADIRLSADLGGQIPASQASRYTGVLFALSPSLTAGWSLGDFSTSLGVSYTRYFNDNPTMRIDCERFPHQCEVAGEDFGVPLGLHGVSASLRLGYKLFGKLSTSVSYSLGNSYGAVEFPEDEYTTRMAQTGIQAGVGYHSGRVALSYKVFEKTTIGMSMGTSRSLYSADGKRITMPFFDLDSDLHHRTSYQFSLSQSL